MHSRYCFIASAFGHCNQATKFRLVYSFRKKHILVLNLDWYPGSEVTNEVWGRCAAVAINHIAEWELENGRVNAP
jgi:hypothetical protein